MGGITEALVVFKAQGQGLKFEQGGRGHWWWCVRSSGSFDVDSAHPLDTLLVLVQVVRAACSAPGGLQQGVVRTPAVLRLVQQDVQGLLIDACLRKLNLREQGVTLPHLSLNDLRTY